MPARTLTFSTGYSIAVAPAPRDVVLKFITIIAVPGPTTAIHYHAAARGLALILPYIVCYPEAVLVEAVRREMAFHNLDLPDDAIAFLMAVIRTPADVRQLTLQLAAGVLSSKAALSA